MALTGLLLAGSTAAFADGQKQIGVSVGPDVGVYFPSDSTIRNVFGSSIFKIGVHFGGSERLSSGRFGVGLGLIDATKNGDHFYLGQALATYEMALGDRKAEVVPYAKAGAGFAYADYVVDDVAGHIAAKRILPAAAVELGVHIGHRFKLSASYNIFSSVDGLNFNGLELQATYIVYRF